MGKIKIKNPEQTFFIVLFIFMLSVTIYRNSLDSKVKKNDARIKPDTHVNDTTRNHTDTLAK